MTSGVSDEPVVVIGSGPSGAVAAARLVERGLDVVMLDSGTMAPRGVVVRVADHTVFRKRFSGTDYRKSSDTAENVDWFSSLSQGGLSNHWTAAVPRFAPADFDDGGRLDERYVWPVTYGELEPYYEIAEHHLTVTAGEKLNGVPSNRLRHRVRLPSDWAELASAANDNGDGVGALPMAKGHPWMVALRGSEFDSYHCVLQSLLESPRFLLRRGAHVDRITAANGRAESVCYIDRASGQTRVQRARAVVVAAGTIDSTMILLRSTSSEHPNGIGNEEGLVGRYLHDHPREWWTATTERPMRALAHPVYVARAPYADSEPLMGTSHTVGLTSGLQRIKSLMRRRVDVVGVQVFGTMVPRPDIGVTLERSGAADAVGDRPRIDLAYDDAAMRNMEFARERLRTVLAGAGLRIEIPGPFHSLRPGSSVHFAGTARMHRDRKFGVVDSFNRVHDLPSVVVADMSCFTTGPEKNPTLTAMALAIRAADQLARDVA